MTTRSRRNVGVDILCCCCGVFVLELMLAVEVGVFSESAGLVYLLVKKWKKKNRWPFGRCLQ